MKTQTHTPGPWKVKLNFGNLFIVADKSRVVSNVHNNQNILTRDREWVKNAYLIAAAPELLEAGKKSLKLLDEIRRYDFNWGHRVFEALPELKDAIAKAEGKQNAQ